jgi:hypothetical protein
MQQFEVFGTRLPGQRDDWLFIGGSALVILIFGALLFWDFNRKNFGGGGEVIGTIRKARGLNYDPFNVIDCPFTLH